MISAHPGLPEFDYIKPESLQEASQFLANHKGESRPFSGGTDCFVRMRDGFYKDRYMVDIKGLDGTNELSFSTSKGLTIGAAICMNKVAAHPEIQKHYPLLVEAANSVASYQLRTRATIIGNICNASPAGDTIGACIVYGGILNVHGIVGRKSIPLTDFFKAPGKTALLPGDIVVSITLPVPLTPHYGKYLKLGRNRISDLSIVGVSVLGYPDKTTTSGYTFKIAVASVAPVPFVAIKAQEMLSKNKITESTINEAAALAMDSVTPIDDVRGSAKYRKYMTRNLVKRGIDIVFSSLSK